MAPKLRSALRAPERPTSDGLTAAIKRANPRQVCLGRTPPKARCSAPTGPTSTRRMPWLENCDRRFVLQRVAQAGGGRAHIGRGVSVGAEYRKTNEGNLRKKGLCACLPPQGYNKVPLGCLSNDPPRQQISGETGNGLRTSRTWASVTASARVVPPPEPISPPWPPAPPSAPSSVSAVRVRLQI